MSNEKNVNNSKGFLSWENILKFIPISIFLLSGYISVMSRLATIEEKLNFVYTEKFVAMEKRIDIKDKQLEELKLKVDNHILYAEQTYYRKEDEYPFPKKRK